jgi:hypothetical protein
MYRLLTLTALALGLVAAPARAAGITGKYVEARTCDVWTAPCFANAEMNLTGKNAVLAWKVEHGSLDGVRLDGLGVAAVIAANDTLGLKQTAPAKALLLVDKNANKAQREALVRLAKRQAGDLVSRVVGVETAPFDMDVGTCDGGACASVRVGKTTRIETRCVDPKHDKSCGTEKAFYPPLSKGVEAKAAVAVEHSFSGKTFNRTWKDMGRREAYVGSFEVR